MTSFGMSQLKWAISSLEEKFELLQMHVALVVLGFNFRFSLLTIKVSITCGLVLDYTRLALE